jgi:hypothetical protein
MMLFQVVSPIGHLLALVHNAGRQVYKGRRGRQRSGGALGSHSVACRCRAALTGRWRGVSVSGRASRAGGRRARAGGVAVAAATKGPNLEARGLARRRPATLHEFSGGQKTTSAAGRPRKASATHAQDTAQPHAASAAPTPLHAHLATAALASVGDAPPSATHQASQT